MVELQAAAWVQESDGWQLVMRWRDGEPEAEPQWVSLPDAIAGEPLLPPVVTSGASRHQRSQLAASLLAAGEPSRSLEIYDELLDELEEASLYNNRGAARSALGDIEGALRDYEHALNHDDKLAQAFSNRGNALTKLGRYEEAISDYDDALRLAGDAAAIYCNRGLTRQLQGDLNGSLVDTEQALAVDERFAPGYLARGGIRAQQGDLTGAIQDLEQFLELAPAAAQAPEVRKALSRLRARLV